MNEQELLQAFIQYLAQKTGAQSQEELEQIIQQMGEEGLKQAYQEFILMIQQQQVLSAKLGAKLNYIKQLRGKCPEGYESKYFKQGGKLCKKCVKSLIMQEGGKAKNSIEEFKQNRKKKYPLTIHNGKGGKKTTYYNDEATRDSILVNRYNDQETQITRPGNYKKGKWVPDRTKAPYNKNLKKKIK